MTGKRPTESRARARGCGVALDVGTTTLAAALVDPSGKETPASTSRPNPQAAWGADVLARIQAVTDEPALTGEMQRSVVGAFNGMIAELCKGREVEIREIAAAGNPVMEHILAGVSPSPMATPPYRPAFKEARRMKAADVGFDAPPEAGLYVFPLIGGFVGGDSVAMLLAIGASRAPFLAIDIGTNSEIIVSSPEKGLFATSAAAGPAFEGGQISRGMTAQKGAVAGVRVRGDEIELDVIGGVAPVGICGSGVIEAVSGLLGAGVIDPSGRLLDPDEVPSNLAGRIKKHDNGNAFTLFRGGAGELTLTQADIRALQLAKAAIKAGVSIALARAGIGPEDIEKVFIAGAFGSNLKEEGLERIGLIDRRWTGRVEGLGDAALRGAALAALSEGHKEEAGRIARAAHYVPLSGSGGFQKEFLENMNFT